MRTVEIDVSTNEMDLLRDVIRALRTLRYGSWNLTVRDGRSVEIQKIEKIRFNSSASKDS